MKKSVQNGLLSQKYGYDNDYNLTSLEVRNGSSLLADNHYEYDKNGNRTEKQMLNGVISYDYNNVGQLQKVDYPTYSEELFYDKRGNRTSRMKNGAEELYNYDLRNRLTQLTKNGQTHSFEYDNVGNLTKDDKVNYFYNEFNQTTKVETFDGNVQINRYDAEGLRYEMEENNRLVQFIFNQNREVVAENSDKTWKNYIRTSELLFSSAEHAKTYYHYASDEMGSITHITQDENVLNEYEYDAWGEVVGQRETIENRFKFNGQQLDPITEQYYLRARFYNPVIARFTQEDTYRGDGLNLYAYCRNNPVYYVDPTGYACETKGELYAKLRQEGTPAYVAYQQSFGKDPLKPDLPFTDLMSAEDRVRYNKWVVENVDSDNFQKYSDEDIVNAANAINYAQYGGAWYGKKNPVSVLVTSDNKVIVTKNNSVIGSKSKDKTKEIFGDDVIIPAGRNKNFDNSSYSIQTSEPKHAEARAIQELLKGDYNIDNVRIATTLKSCSACERLIEKFNIEITDSHIINLTGNVSDRKV